jgi:hypothetical protein
MEDLRAAGLLDPVDMVLNQLQLESANEQD